MTRPEVVDALRRLGWRIRTTGELTQAIRHFQDAWRLGPKLTVDGIPGPRTQAALAMSIARLGRKKPTASANFSFHEFACKCGGKYSRCPRIWVKGALIDRLEKLRDQCYPGGLTPLSGCRCEDHNRQVNGASNSQHKYGAACDITPKASKARVAALNLFSGIGFNASTGLVAHVDIRQLSGHNTTRATSARPTVWRYGR